MQLKHTEKNTMDNSKGKYKFQKLVWGESEGEGKLVKAPNGTGLSAVIPFIPHCSGNSWHGNIRGKKEAYLSGRRREKCYYWG